MYSDVSFAVHIYARWRHRVITPEISGNANDELWYLAWAKLVSGHQQNADCSESGSRGLRIANVK